jgi:hypothetical protein
MDSSVTQFLAGRWLLIHMFWAFEEYDSKIAMINVITGLTELFEKNDLIRLIISYICKLAWFGYEPTGRQN